MAGRINLAAFDREEAPPKTRAKKRDGYLAFIRQLPCAVTGRIGVEAAHVSYASPMHGHWGRGKGTKAPDRFALPLNPDAHRAQHAMNERAFWEMHGIDPHSLANTLWGIYSDYDEAEAIKRCTARIRSWLPSLDSN